MTVSFSGSAVAVPLGTPPRNGVLVPAVDGSWLIDRCEVVPAVIGDVPDIGVSCCAAAGADSGAARSAVASRSEAAFTKIPFPSARGTRQKGRCKGSGLVERQADATFRRLIV